MNKRTELISVKETAILSKQVIDTFLLSNGDIDEVSDKPTSAKPKKA